MNWSLKLITIRGIPIRVHISFLLVIAWAALLGLRGTDVGASGAGWLDGVVFMVAFVLLLFVCVVLHELGHSLVAQLFGIKVQDITLWPVGGVARMARLPEQPYQEFLITAAGPATNILLTILLAGLTLVWIGPMTLLTLAASPRLLALFLSRTDGQSLLILLLLNNLLLALFNLIPAFPMDGGRLLRSLLASVLPFGRATEIASLVGQGLAVVMAMIALLTGNFFLGLIGLFVFMAAWQERQQVTWRTSLHGLQVRQAMQPLGTPLHPLQTLGAAAAQAATSAQTAYLVVDGGRLVGLLLRRDLLSGMRRAGPEARVGQYMQRDVLQLRPNDLLSDAQSRLAELSRMAAVVVDNGRVVGLLSQADLMRLIEMLNAHPEALQRG